jgi:ubiquinone/menaquinone biosynthesis C-methylase UbiE
VGFWERRVVPRLVEVTCAMKDLEPLRAELCGGLSGRVIELGFGSGLNTRHYPSSVVSVDAVEPSDVGWRMSAERRAEADVPIARVGLDAQRVGADDAAYHCALSTFTLCTIPDATAALEEVRRVLLPGGSLYFMEHGRAPTDRVRRWQRRVEPFQKRLAGGCHLTRDIPDLVRAAGLEVVELAEDYLPGPGASHPWGYVYRGRAVKVA